MIKPGMWADLTIADIDPLVVGATEPGDLLDGRVLATIVAGRVVFELQNSGF
jgi:predicted amidohydrolase YtcJ